MSTEEIFNYVKVNDQISQGNRMKGLHGWRE